MTNHHCLDREPMEGMPQYAQRVLGYALTFGIEPLTLSQLEIADSYAQQIVTSQPGTHEPHHQVLDQILHALRLRIAARMTAKRSQLASLQHLIDQAYQESETPANDPHGSQEFSAPQPQASEQEQAIRLLRAALMLIMQPPDNRDGGKGARLITPTPKLPSGGIIMPIPSTPSARRF